VQQAIQDQAVLADSSAFYAWHQKAKNLPSVSPDTDTCADATAIFATCLTSFRKPTVSTIIFPG